MTLEHELLEINQSLALKEIDDALKLCKGDVVETKRMMDALLDIRRILTP